MPDNNENGKEKLSVMEKVASFIVDRRNLFFLIFIIALIFSVFASSWTKVENDITTYLPESTETRQGLTLMNDQFVTYGSAEVMVSNITYQVAEELCSKIEEIEGVDSVDFDDTDEHYKDTSALFNVTFTGEADDQVSLDAMDSINKLLSDYDLYVSTEVGSDSSAQLDQEMQVVTMIAAVIIFLVLLFTSKSYAEIPVLGMTFGAAALLNSGTNFVLGTISFISNSVTIVLQLALAIDYAIILCHRYSEEHEKLPAREACIVALSKAIPEISSSSLTTISGLGALAFMKFGIGKDLAFVLIKAIMFSLLSVFTLMPGLLMLFSNLIDKTQHRNFVPKISAVGRFAYKTKWITPSVFLVLAVFGFVFSNKCPYAYGQSDLHTIRQNESKVVTQKIEDTFGSTNLAALVVPVSSYDNEAKLIDALEQYDQIDSVMGLSNIEAMDGYMLTDKLTPRQFSELIDLDYEVAEVLYAAYAADEGDYGDVINSLSSYSVPLIDIFMFLYDMVQDNYVNLDADLNSELEDVHAQLEKAQLQLSTDEYSRILVYLNLPEEGQETFDFLETIHDTMAKYYTKDYYIVGNTTSDYDLSSSFSTDNLIISILSVLFVIVILLFTFQSAGLPILLIAVIEGSIWINFSFPYLQDSNLYFLSYLIVSSIQMGANIDYAIVISSRYMDLKQKMPIREAIIETLNQAFPTIVTSGTILAAAGILIGILSTDGAISSIGICLGRGTIISIMLVMFVLPQLLLLGDIIIEKTSFTIKKPEKTRSLGTIIVNGYVRGNINGTVDGIVRGRIKGEVDAIIDTKNSTIEEDGATPESEVSDDHE